MADEHTAFGTRGSQVQILPLRPNKTKDLAAPPSSLIPLPHPKRCMPGIDGLALVTLADVRELIDKHLPKEHRAKFTWRQLAHRKVRERNDVQ